ncbi:tandem C2 domains nuclear protein [Eucyclogobius newberryi]|uniref:tandem C2 domains nuclear protein n=1 Tax=Eucyclogobius newberryi TaxID=166745 RepID=UPI003B5C29C2
MECFKNCCKTFTRKKEQETQVITMKMPPGVAVEHQPVEQRSLPEDYLLSKMPPDGRVVPFVLPTFKPSYVQPRVQMFPNLQPGPQSSARCTYAERKAELLGSTYCPESSLHQVQTIEYNSPGSTQRNGIKSAHSPNHKVSSHPLKLSEQKLSSSTFDLSTPQGHIQRFDSASSVFSSESSLRDSIESSLDSITLSGDERELGKLCVRVSYQEALEQVWITLVQCSDLCLSSDGGEQQKFGFKGIITVPKPIQFKSSVQAFQQDVRLMETFVFSLHLQQLRCSALVLRLQSHSSRTRTVGECVLSLRTLGPAETEHWLELNSPSKSSAYHSELHLSTCFQPVNGRIQLQIFNVQNLPPSSSPLTQAFFVKSELHQCGHVVMKRKTKALKASGGVCEWKDTCHFPLESLDQACSLTIRLYSRSSVRRKQCLGQIVLGLESAVPEAVDQWKDTMAHPEKVVTGWHRLSPPEKQKRPVDVVKD